MAAFRFEEGKSFAENCEAFLETLKSDDPEMAAILADNWGALVTIIREEERDSKARGEFNSGSLRRWALSLNRPSRRTVHECRATSAQG